MKKSLAASYERGDNLNLTNGLKTHWDRVVSTELRSEYGDNNFTTDQLFYPQYSLYQM